MQYLTAERVRCTGVVVLLTLAHHRVMWRLTVTSFSLFFVVVHLTALSNSIFVVFKLKSRSNSPVSSNKQPCITLTN